MATSRNSSVKSRTISRSISTALASAVLEWLLICMLFINAMFSYLITKFARHYELQTPCLLCSRLDHVLGKKKWKYYWDLICRIHKLEISSLVLCHAHNNLVDIHGMCENCLFSFATINNCNAETYKLLVGKLGEDSSFGLDQDPETLIEGHNSGTRNCFCCKEPRVPSGCGRKLMQTKSVGSEAADFDVPLAGPNEHQHNRKKSGDGLDPLSHVVLSKLNSKDDSEVNFPDDGKASSSFPETNPKDYQLPEPCIITLPDESASEKLINQVSTSESTTLVSSMQSDPLESHLIACPSCAAAVEHGLEKNNWQCTNLQADIPAVSGLVLHDDIPVTSKESPVEGLRERNLIALDNVCPSSAPIEQSQERELISFQNDSASAITRDIPVETSEESKTMSLIHVNTPCDTRPTSLETSTQFKLISLVDVLPSPHAEDTQGLEDSGVARSEEVQNTLVTDSGESLKAENRSATTTVSASEVNPVPAESGPQATNLLDLSDAYKLAVGNRGRQLSGTLAEQWLAKDSSKISEDLKLLLSQLSSAREQSMPDLSPRVPMSPRFPMSPKLSLNSDEWKTSDASNAIGMQILQKRISLERNESGLSIDGTSVSEIEGESAVDRLRRQVEHDKKLMGALYKELEEERSASAIAANQAMAMITRLQEEKAALQMEALQCLRMMEGQAEYDMEALRQTNDLLAEKERELQDLEAELECYREKYPNKSMLENMVEPVSAPKATDVGRDLSEASQDDTRTCIFRNLVEFEDERSYILQSLKRLEKKLYLFSNHGVTVDIAGSEHSGNNEDAKMNSKELHNKLGLELNSGVEEGDLSIQNNQVSEPRGHVSSLEKPETSAEENIEIFCGGQSSPLHLTGTELDALINEISDLNEKLKALEADRTFLELTVNSIRHGEEGLQLVQEVASHLKELRRIGMRRKPHHAD